MKKERRMQRNHQLETPWVSGGFRARLWATYNGFIKEVENLGSRYGMIGSIYRFLFYRSMVRKEILLCGLSPEDRVVHIGSGSLPMTALSLAKAGFEVVALDNDPAAVANASRFLRRSVCQGKASAREVDGLEVDCGTAEAAWVSFLVYPKEEVLKRAFASLKEGGKLIYRNPVGLLSLVFPKVEPDTIAPSVPARRVRQFPGKETVVITKASGIKQEPMEKSRHTSRLQGEVPLGSLRKGQEAVIATVPEVSLLPPLGFRPGKAVRIQARGHFGGPVFAEIEKRCVALEPALAGKVTVIPRETQELPYDKAV